MAISDLLTQHAKYGIRKIEKAFDDENRTEHLYFPRLAGLTKLQVFVVVISLMYERGDPRNSSGSEARTDS